MAPIRETYDQDWSYSMMVKWWILILMIFVISMTTVFVCACCGGGSARIRRQLWEEEMDATVDPPPDPTSPSLGSADTSERESTKPGTPEMKKKKRRKRSSDDTEDTTKREWTGKETTKHELIKVASKPECDIAKKAVDVQKKAIVDRKKEIQLNPLPLAMKIIMQEHKREPVSKPPKLFPPDPSANFVAKERLNAYRTLNLADSAVFNKPDPGPIQENTQIMLSSSYPETSTTGSSSNDKNTPTPKKEKSIFDDGKYVANKDLDHYKTLAIADSQIFDK